MKFEMGKIVITSNAYYMLNIWFVSWIIKYRYSRGDWGNIPESDWRENDKSLTNGGRLLASYTDVNGVKFWIITEADRSYTTVLLPEDY